MRKSRYGVVYMRAIAGQAGCGFAETSPDEDRLAVDYSLQFPEGDARVQVKTTKKYAIDGDELDLSFSAEDQWIKKWSRVKVPLYFVIVVVPDDSEAWLNHNEAGTLMVRTAAYWVQLDAGQFEDSKTIRVPRSQRVNADTVRQWHEDFRALFTPNGAEEVAA